MPAVVVPAVGVLAVLFGQIRHGGVACGHPAVHGIQQALVDAGVLGEQLLPVLHGVAGRALLLRPFHLPSWIVYYLAFSIPVLIAGVAITRFGLHQTAVV